MLTKKKLIKALINCGIKKNDNIYVTSSLFALGDPKISNKKIL